MGLVRAMGDPAPATADAAARAAARLVRRRFGLSLPPPFIGEPGPEEPIRVARAEDGAAVAAVKWRVFGTSYRGLFSDRFLDNRDVVPPVSYWTGRAMVPPSRRHRLLVWGRPGTVFGYLDCGPATAALTPADDATPTAAVGAGESAGDDHRDRSAVGEVFELYVDPSASAVGGGTRLLEAAEDWLGRAGLARLELSVLETNAAARTFYERRGWVDSGRRVVREVSGEHLIEARYEKGAPDSE